MANSMPLYVITMVLALLGLAVGCKHDKTKCRDLGNDCCENSGMSCTDGYTVKKNTGKCGFLGLVQQYQCCAPPPKNALEEAAGECDQVDNSKCSTIGRHDGACTAAIAWGAREQPGCDAGYRVEKLGERTVLGIGAQAYNCRNEEACGAIVVIILIVVGVVVACCVALCIGICCWKKNQAQATVHPVTVQTVQPAVAVPPPTVVVQPQPVAGVAVQPQPVVGVAVQPQPVVGVAVQPSNQPTNQPAVAVPVQPQTLNVQIPEGITEGQQMQVQGPNGMFTFNVPAGAVPGQTFQVQVPPAQ